MFVKKAKLHYLISNQAPNLIMVRHGQSQWNRTKRWAGWTDIGLSLEGINQSIQCGKMLKKKEIKFDQTYTSVLKRSIISLNYILDQMNVSHLPVIKNWRLNQKNYGCLQGQSKQQITAKYGQEMVQKWRRSYDIRPPPLSIHDIRHPVHDKKYQNINSSQLPSSESSKDIIGRIKPLLLGEIIPKIRSGKKILIVTHGNVMRALIQELFEIQHSQVSKLNFPNSTPVCIEFKENLYPKRYYLMGSKEKINKQMEDIQNETKIFPQVQVV